MLRLGDWTCLGCNLTGGSAQGAAQSAEPVTYCCDR